MSILEKIKDAGVVGCGGGAFRPMPNLAVKWNT